MVLCSRAARERSGARPHGASLRISSRDNICQCGPGVSHLRPRSRNGRLVLTAVTDITAVDLSSVVGLTAMVLLTLNILMGLLVSTNYSPARQWPHRRLPWPLFKIHNWTGYAALSVALLHPAILLFSSTAH